MLQDGVIINDWLSFTSKEHGHGSIISMLGLYDLPFTHTRGARGYVNRLYYDGISVHYGGRDEVWVEMSGQGCRSFETYSELGWVNLFAELHGNSDYHVTRLDVAYDDRSGLLPLDIMCNDIQRGNFVSKFKWWGANITSDGISLYHGSPKSDLRFRIYDKARERGREDEGHWVRCEIQMRDDRAAEFIRLVLQQPVGTVFAGVINNYLRYVSSELKNGKKRVDQKDRWPHTEYWRDFMCATEKISLYVAPGIEYNFDRLQRFAVQQAGSAAGAMIQLVGADEYISQALQRYEEVRNPKHIDIVQRMVYDRCIPSNK